MMSATPQRRGSNGPVVSGPNSVSGNLLGQRVIPADQHSLSYAPAGQPTTGAGDNPNHRIPHCCRDGGNPEGHVNGAP
jgi:hypothetical protein